MWRVDGVEKEANNGSHPGTISNDETPIQRLITGERDNSMGSGIEHTTTEIPLINKLPMVKEQLFVMGVLKLFLRFYTNREEKKGGVFPQSQRLKTLLNSLKSVLLLIGKSNL